MASTAGRTDERRRKLVVYKKSIVAAVVDNEEDVKRVVVAALTPAEVEKRLETLELGIKTQSDQISYLKMNALRTEQATGSTNGKTMVPQQFAPINNMQGTYDRPVGEVTPSQWPTSYTSANPWVNPSQTHYPSQVNMGNYQQLASTNGGMGSHTPWTPGQPWYQPQPGMYNSQQSWNQRPGGAVRQWIPQEQFRQLSAEEKQNVRRTPVADRTTTTFRSSPMRPMKALPPSLPPMRGPDPVSRTPESRAMVCVVTMEDGSTYVDESQGVYELEDE